MTALKKERFVARPVAAETRKSRLKIAAAEYHTEVTAAEIKAEKKKIAKDFDFDDWDVVDGPAW